MSMDEFAPWFVNFALFLGNAIVCSAAVRSHLRRARRSVLLIAISSGLGAVMTLVSWMCEVEISRLASLVAIIDVVLWTVGCCLLFRDLAEADDGFAE